MSIIYLLRCATQFVCVFSPLECLPFIVHIFWPPTNQLSKFPGVSHNGQAPPVLHFSHDIFVPLFLRCPCPSPAAAPQWLMVYSTAKLNFSFPSLFPLSPPFGNRGWTIDAALAALENKVHLQQISEIVSP